MKILISYFIILLLLSSCYRPTPQQSFNDLQQLEGKWMSSQNVQFNEHWEIKSDTLMQGMGFSLQENDTAFKEELKIYYKEGIVYYAVKVGGSLQFVSFKLIEAKKNLWIFENKTHDYPNIINYKLLDDNELTATTTNSNGNKKIEFVMKRTQQ